MFALKHPAIQVLLIIIISSTLCACTNDEPQDPKKTLDASEKLNDCLFKDWEEVQDYIISEELSAFVVPTFWIRDVQTNKKYFLFPSMNFTVPAKGGSFELIWGLSNIEIDGVFSWDSPEYYSSGWKTTSMFDYFNEPDPHFIDIHTEDLENGIYPDMPFIPNKTFKDSVYGEYTTLSFPANNTGKIRKMFYAPISHVTLDITHNGMPYRLLIGFTQVAN